MSVYGFLYSYFFFFFNKKMESHWTCYFVIDFSYTIKCKYVVNVFPCDHIVYHLMYVPFKHTFIVGHYFPIFIIMLWIFIFSNKYFYTNFSKINFFNQTVFWENQSYFVSVERCLLTLSHWFNKYFWSHTLFQAVCKVLGIQ